jgi:NAD(P)H-hydrate epimerase
MSSLDELFMMEKASLRLWDQISRIIEEKLDHRSPIVAVAGKGNNGGDALAVLRHMWFSGYTRLTAIVSSETLSRSCKRQRDILKTLGISILCWDTKRFENIAEVLNEACLVLDGVLGVGISVEASGEAREMIDLFNSSAKNAIKIAIDIPSGIGDYFSQGYRCISADHTCVVEPEKIALYLPNSRLYCGKIHLIRDIFPSTLVKQNTNGTILEQDDMLSLSQRVSPNAYKNSRGRVAIFAGAKGTAGAARLCAKAALAAGAGYCTLYIDEDCYDAVLPDMESVVIKILDARKALELDSDVILVGPGWGEAIERVDILKSILKSGKPVILDASALRLIAQHSLFEYIKPRITSLTPHPGEFNGIAQALGYPESMPFFESFCKIADTLQVTLIYKSHVTWICTGSARISVLDGMKPELGTAGSGDVLAGLYAGICAQSLAIEKANHTVTGSDNSLEIQEILVRSAQLAVLAHLSAGFQAALERGWFLSEDLIPWCSKILHDLSISKA